MMLRYAVDHEWIAVNPAALGPARACLAQERC